MDSELRAAETELADANERLNALHAQHARLTRFWHYFKRRSLEQRIRMRSRRALLRTACLADARAASEALEKEAGPEFPGVSVDGRRAINTAAIAYAEVLCLRLVKTQLVALAREATSRARSQTTTVCVRTAKRSWPRSGAPVPFFRPARTLRRK